METNENRKPVFEISLSWLTVKYATRKTDGRSSTNTWDLYEGE